MKTKTKALKNNDNDALWDSSLLWSTIALYSFGALIFFWTALVKVITWVGA